MESFIDIFTQYRTVIVFVFFSCFALFLDIFMHKESKVITLKNASLWSVFWIFTALLFAVYLYFFGGTETIAGPQMASLFITGYALEKILSVDNLFVMMAIFAWFNIPEQYRHRILYWGIIGAIVFRGIFVLIGTSLFALGPYVELVFALIVGWTAVMMLKKSAKTEEVEDYSSHFAFKLVKKWFPLWPKIHGNQFFISRNVVEEELLKPENKEIKIDTNKGKKGKYFATPLFVCLAIIELSDVMFAFDSVPAIIAVSKEPIIVYSAMMFAILGLRTMYFVLEALKDQLHYLEKAVVILLFFVAFKIGLNSTNHLFHHGYSIEASHSLIIVMSVLFISIVLSLLKKKA
ncbi:TerC/Alx family metal homeostasis membrane protein [Thorsellia kenyensis]|uniref:TerC/Alx family metal homeostasis membrane protein n=1 Tax=Thorsellia kenyensis TaxID=1549888 RepID=A0ABV6C7V3_9GAMM